jgi:hypothetical protein
MTLLELFIFTVDAYNEAFGVFTPVVDSSLWTLVSTLCSGFLGEKTAVS